MPETLAIAALLVLGGAAQVGAWPLAKANPTSMRLWYVGLVAYVVVVVAGGSAVWRNP